MASFAAYTQVTRLSLAEAMAYRATMLLSILTGPIFLSIQYFIWQAIFSQQSVVAGYAFTDMVSYFVLVLLFSYLTYDNAHEVIEKRILQGEMHQTFLRPIDLMTELFFFRIGHRIIAAAIEWLPMMLLFAIVLGPSVVMPASFILAIIGLSLAFTIRFQMQYLIGLAAFWTTNTHGTRMLNWWLSAFLGGVMFPLAIFPAWAQNILVFTPFPYLAYAGISLYQGQYSLGVVSGVLHGILIGAGWVIALYIAGRFVERRAFERYQGVGQ